MILEFPETWKINQNRPDNYEQLPNCLGSRQDNSIKKKLSWTIHKYFGYWDDFRLTLEGNIVMSSDESLHDFMIDWESDRFSDVSDDSDSRS